MSLAIYLNEIGLQYASYFANIIFGKRRALNSFILGLAVKITVDTEKAVLAFFDSGCHNSLLESYIEMAVFIFS